MSKQSEKERCKHCFYLFIY